MNLLMINPVHPATAHISAVRAWRFSQELSRLGHRVVLLTGPSPDGSTPSAEFDAHDWSAPYVLSCTTNTGSAANASLGEPLRKLGTAWNMLSSGGTQGDWVRCAVITIARRAESFKPDLVWCTFGKMEAVFAAQRIAARARCPWVLDIKDNWELYVPRGMRRLMAWRTRGWSAVTANAGFTADKARRWQRAQAEVVYSGVDGAFYEQSPAEHGAETAFRLNLVGSLYCPESLDTIVRGLRKWAEGLPDPTAAKTQLCYMGADGARFDSAVGAGLSRIEVRNAGYIDTQHMAALCRAAAVNAYIGHPGTFHHKLLELLACDRPILVVPSETTEEKSLARKAGGLLLEAADEDEVAGVIGRIFADWQATPVERKDGVEPSREFSWSTQAASLNTILQQVLTGSRGAK